MLDKEIVAGWLGSMGVDDLQLILELIDCPENGLDAYASEYGPHPDTVVLINQRNEALKALRSTLIACGVLREDCDPDGADLLCAAECFCENHKKPNVTGEPSRKKA